MRDNQKGADEAWNYVTLERGYIVNVDGEALGISAEQTFLIRVEAKANEGAEYPAASFDELAHGKSCVECQVELCDANAPKGTRTGSSRRQNVLVVHDRRRSRHDESLHSESMAKIYSRD